MLKVTNLFLSLLQSNMELSLTAMENLRQTIHEHDHFSQETRLRLRVLSIAYRVY